MDDTPYSMQRVLYTRTARAGQTDQVVIDRKFSLILEPYRKTARQLSVSVQASAGRSGWKMQLLQKISLRLPVGPKNRIVPPHGIPPRIGPISNDLR